MGLPEPTLEFLQDHALLLLCSRSDCFVQDRSDLSGVAVRATIINPDWARIHRVFNDAQRRHAVCDVYTFTSRTIVNVTAFQDPFPEKESR